MFQCAIFLVFLNIICNVWLTFASSGCYSSTDKAQFCQPNFINVVHDATTLKTTTCNRSGYTKSMCNLSTNNCFNCDKGKGNILKNISSLFDRHTKSYNGCWISGKQVSSTTVDIKNVTINFDKLYEAYYVTIEFCERLPDSIIFFKSIDYGKSWIPWQYFSNSCQKTFGKRRILASKIERQLKFEHFDPVCFALPKNNHSFSSKHRVVAFNPTIGRSANLSNLMVLKEWSSLTNLKISIFVDYFGTRRHQRASNLEVADITIGGRVQCFGHANELRKINNSFVCECQHNTTGKECNKCLGTHSDQPWTPLSSSDYFASECQKCFCNNHATECIFDSVIYVKQQALHGSRCLNCLHHTTGSNCETCASGYFRVAGLPMNHTKICQKCKCHSIGSNDTLRCGPISGNCHCKVGVEGKTCNRCKKGYQQTRSSVNPCAPDVQKTMMATEERCAPCGKNIPRIKFKKFCRREIMIKISIQSKEIHGEWTRFGVTVDEVWRSQSLTNSQFSIHEPEYSIYPIWVENSNLRCKCPLLELGQIYLLLTKIKQKLYRNQLELIVDRKSHVLTWRDNWPRRLVKFKEKEKQGECARFKFKRKHSRQMFRSYRYRYMNDS